MIIRESAKLVNYSVGSAAVKKVCMASQLSIYIDSSPRHCPVSTL